MKGTLQVLAVVVTIIAGLHATKINKCKEGSYPPIDNIKVVLGDCKDENPCVLNRGDTYNFSEEFEAPKDADHVETLAIGSAYGFSLELFSAADNEACKNIYDSKNKKGACPLKKGEKYTYKKAIQIGKGEIRATVKIQWYLVHGNETLNCFEIPLKIQDKPK